MKNLIDFINGIEKAKKITLPMLIFFIIFYSCFGYPIKSGHLSDIIWLAIIPIVIECFMLAALFKGKIIQMYCVYLICNAFGILLHFILEYGEASIQRDFNIINIIIYLFLMPMVVNVGSVTIQLGMAGLTNENE